MQVSTTKRLIAAPTVLAALVCLGGCASFGAVEPSSAERAQACESASAAFKPIVDSFELSSSAETIEAMEIHLTAAEDSLRDAAEATGPNEFVPLRDELVRAARTFIAEGRDTLAGDASGLDVAEAEMLQAFSALDTYCR